MWFVSFLFLFVLLACFALPRRHFRQQDLRSLLTYLGRSRFRITPRPLRYTRSLLPYFPVLLTSLLRLPYFLRSTIIRSVRLLRRVFLPSVGKAHGVCG